MTNLTPPSTRTRTGVAVGDIIRDPDGRRWEIVWTSWDRIRVVNADEPEGRQVIYPIDLPKK